MSNFGFASEFFNACLYFQYKEGGLNLLPWSNVLRIETQFKFEFCEMNTFILLQHIFIGRSFTF